MKELAAANSGHLPQFLTDRDTPGLVLSLYKKRPAGYIYRDRRDGRSIEYVIGDIDLFGLTEARTLVGKIQDLILKYEEISPDEIRNYVKRAITNQKIAEVTDVLGGEWTFLHAINEYTAFRRVERSDIRGVTVLPLSPSSLTDIKSKCLGPLAACFISPTTPLSTLTADHLRQIVDGIVPSKLPASSIVGEVPNLHRYKNRIKESTRTADKKYRQSIRNYIIDVLAYASDMDQKIHIDDLKKWKVTIDTRRVNSEAHFLPIDVAAPRLQSAWQKISRENWLGTVERAYLATFLFTGGGPRASGISRIRRCDLIEIDTEITDAYLGKDEPKGAVWGLWVPKPNENPDLEAIKQNKSRTSNNKKQYAFPIAPEAYRLIKMLIETSGEDSEILPGVRRWLFESKFSTGREKKVTATRRHASAADKRQRQSLYEIYSRSPNCGRIDSKMMSRVLGQAIGLMHQDLRKYFPTIMNRFSTVLGRPDLNEGTASPRSHQEDAQRAQRRTRGHPAGNRELHAHAPRQGRDNRGSASPCGNRHHPEPTEDQNAEA
jgi:integrase